MSHPDGVAASLQQTLTDALMRAWVQHPTTKPGEWGKPSDVYFSVERAVEVLVPVLSTIHPQSDDGAYYRLAQELSLLWDVEATSDDLADAEQLIRKRVVAPPPSGGWQPIATAPKEHKRVLMLYGCEFGRHILGRGYWFKGVPGDDEGWVTSGFYTSPEDDMRGTFTPTHWMPLPRPPVEET